ncbi:glutathione S-transferase, partial [Nannochloropsis gaditana CCMP526]
ALAKYAESPWFLPGTEPSLVDIIFAPKVERVIASCLYWKGLTLRQHPDLPALSRWLDALDHRPSYAAFKADFFTLINSLEPLFGRAYSVNTPEVAELQQKLDGF